MNQLFREVKAEDGTVSYEVIQVEDIPEEIVREHGTFKSVLAESVARRQTIADLKKKSEQSTPSSDDEDPETTPEAPKQEAPNTPENVVQFNPDELYEQFKARLVKEQAEERQAQESHQAMVTRIAKENNVNPALLRGSTEAELTSHAQEIAKETLKFSQIGANQTSTVNNDEILKGIDKRFGWN